MNNCDNCEGFGTLRVPFIDIDGNLGNMMEVACAACFGVGEIEVSEVNETWKDCEC